MVLLSCLSRRGAINDQESFQSPLKKKANVPSYTDEITEILALNNKEYWAFLHGFNPVYSLC